MPKPIKILLAANLFQAVFLMFNFSKLPNQIPLFYSQPWGESQIADSWFILILPILMNFMFVLNYQISKRFFQEHPIIMKLFLIANYVLIIGFTGILFKIVFLVT